MSHPAVTSSYLVRGGGKYVVRRPKVVGPSLKEAQRAAGLCNIRRQSSRAERRRYLTESVRTRPEDQVDEVAVTHNHVEITYGDLQRLRPKVWLNDEVINLYLQLVAEKVRSDYNTVLVLPSHFFTFLVDSGRCFKKKKQPDDDKDDDTDDAKDDDKDDELVFDYSEAGRFTKRARPPLCQRRLLVMPVHRVMHWTLVVIQISIEQEPSGEVLVYRVTWLDSYHGPFLEDYQNKLKTFLEVRVLEWSLTLSLTGPSP